MANYLDKESTRKSGKSDNSVNCLEPHFKSKVACILLKSHN